MTKYLEPSFSVLPPPGTNYRDNHDRIFGKKNPEPVVEESAGDCESSSPPYEGDDPQAGGPGLSLSEVQIINLRGYLDDLIQKADSVAEKAYEGGPNKMVDHARWGEAVCVSSVLNDVRTCLLTGVRTAHHLWEPPIGASRD